MQRSKNILVRSEPKIATKRESKFVTSFRGRPEQPVRDLVLQGDIALRQAVRTVFKKGIVENKHVYKKKDEPRA